MDRHIAQTSPACQLGQLTQDTDESRTHLQPRAQLPAAAVPPCPARTPQGLRGGQAGPATTPLPL